MASFWTELRRRSVFRVGFAYLASAWVLIEVVDTLVSIVDAPTWLSQVVVLAAALGFPIALLLAWFYELTPDGVRANADLDAVETVSFLSRKIDFAIIGLLVVAVAFLVFENYVTDASIERERSIAVLPFISQSESEENSEFFSTGMHDALLTQLSKFGDLRVISRTSVLEYANTTKNTRQIAEELGVTTIMEGSVLRAGDRLRINVQLIDGTTDEHLWAEIYDRELTAENVFAVQREMATSIAGMLRANLTLEEQTELNRIPTLSERALQSFYTGNEFARQPNERENMPFAIQAYERAVDEDPMFVLAWAALARAHVQLYRMGGDRSADRAAMAARALDRARALAPDAPEVHFATGNYQMFVSENIELAITELEAALRGLPGSADILNSLASTYRRVGRYEDSLAFRNRAMELDPRNTDALLSLGAGTYARMRNYDAATATLDRALEIAPDNPMLHWVKAVVPLWRDGDVSALRALVAEPPVDLGRFGVRAGVQAATYDRDYSAALAILEDLRPGIINNRNRLLWSAQAYLLSGQDEAAARVFNELLQVAMSASRDPDDVRTRIYQGAALAGLGEHEAAVDAGRTALEFVPGIVDPDEVERIREDLALWVFGPAGAVDLAVDTLEALLSNPGFFSIEGLVPYPGLDPIREHPRFVALVARHRRAP